jgi:hypothetical protein
MQSQVLIRARKLHWSTVLFFLTVYKANLPPIVQNSTKGDPFYCRQIDGYPLYLKILECKPCSNLKGIVSQEGVSTETIAARSGRKDYIMPGQAYGKPFSNLDYWLWQYAVWLFSSWQSAV